MLVLGINRILKWVQITTGWGTYTCPTKQVNDELFFKFKNKWYRVIDFTSEFTTELVSEEGKNISRKLEK